MDQQKQIQFLKPLLKSKNKIAKHLGIDRETVSKYWEKVISDGVLTSGAPDWSRHIDWDYFQKEFSQVQKLPTYSNVARYYRLYERKKITPEISLKVTGIPGHYRKDKKV